MNKQKQSKKYYYHFALYVLFLSFTILFALITIFSMFNIILLIITLLSALLTYDQKKKVKEHDANKEEIKPEQKKNIFEHAKTILYSHEIKANHVSGIDNMTPNVECGIIFKEENDMNIRDKALGKVYTLKYNKITNIGLMSEKEIKDIYKSKGNLLANVVCGGLLLGNIGMLIGASNSNQIVRQKEVAISHYLIINYKNDDNTKVLLFKVNNNIGNLKRIVEDLKRTKILTTLFEEL